MSNSDIARMLKEIILRLDNIERREIEVHAKVTTGGEAPLKSGDPAFRFEAREFLKGNKEPMKAIGRRGMNS